MSELYTLPEGWKWKNVEELCEILDYKRKPISQKDRVSGDYPYYGASGILDYVHDYIFDERLVLIGEDGAKWGANENSSFIAEGKYWVNNHVHIIRPDNQKVIDSFLIYYLNDSDLSEYITGATVKKLNQKKLKSITIPLPPLQEQKRIVAKLDALFAKLDQAIILHQQNIDEADKFMGSVLNEVFGELEEKYGLIEVGTVTNCLVPQRNKPKRFIGDIPWVTTDDLRLFKRINKSTKGMGLRKEDILEVKSKTIPKDSVLMSCVGDLGIVAIADAEIVVNQQLHTYQCHDNLINDYLMYALYVKRDFMYQIANITTVAYMNKSKCNSIPLPLPPLKTQQKTVTYLDQLSQKTEALKQIQKEKLENLKSLKASILDKAFRGEL